MNADAAPNYTGHDNLEVMEEAQNYNAWLVALAFRHIPRADRILDFGAGTGTLTKLLQRTYPRLIALEPDPAQAASLAAQRIPVVRDISEITDSSLDGIVSFNVLEHIEDDGEALRLLVGKLRPGAPIFIYVPAFSILYGEMDRKVGHVRRYRRSDLKRLVRASCLHIESCRYADSLGFFASLALRWFGTKDGILDRDMVRLYDRIFFPVSRMIDKLVGGSFGKNVYIVARRRAE